MANVAVPFPGEIDEFQPDGSIASIRLLGHPYTGVFQTDRYGHPVVRDDDGWFVYASHHNTTLSHNGRRHLQPSINRVGIDDPPTDPVPDLSTLARSTASLDFHEILGLPRSILPQVEGNSENETEPLFQLNDLLCNGMDRSQWCPNNNVTVSSLSRSNTVIPGDLGGVVNLLVILVKFSDQQSRPLSDRSRFDKLFNGRGLDNDVIPTGSIQRFFQIQSAGKVQANAWIEDWVVAPNSEEYYSFGRHGLTAMFAETANGALDQMDQRGTDWSQFDRDNVRFCCFVILLYLIIDLTDLLHRMESLMGFSSFTVATPRRPVAPMSSPTRSLEPTVFGLIARPSNSKIRGSRLTALSGSVRMPSPQPLLAIVGRTSQESELLAMKWDICSVFQI